jgi:importin subunit alpha-6/7
LQQAAIAPSGLTVDQLPALVAGIRSNNSTQQLEATGAIRRLLSAERQPPIDRVIESGILPDLMQFLMRYDIGLLCLYQSLFQQFVAGNYICILVELVLHPFLSSFLICRTSEPKLQFEAAWALTNIASGTSLHTRTVVEHGAVPIFVELLRSPSEEVREQAVWALGNIAGDSPDLRDLVLRSGALERILALFVPDTKISLLRNFTWTLSNFCRGKPQPSVELISPLLPTMAQLIYSPDGEILTDALWALSYLTDGPNDRMQQVLDTGVTRRVVELLVHPIPAVQTAALRVVGNIVTGDDIQTQSVINAGGLPCLLSLLSSSRKGTRKEATWTISNILAGTKEQIQAVIDASIIPVLINILSTGEYEVRKEAAWSLSNATSGGTSMQIAYMVQHGVIPPLIEMLHNSNDMKMIVVALEGLENILKAGAPGNGLLPPNSSEQNPFVFQCEQSGLAEKLEELQESSNDVIYNKSFTLLATYFGGQNEEEQMESSVSESTSTSYPSVPFNVATNGLPNAFGVNSQGGHPQTPLSSPFPAAQSNFQFNNISFQ